MGLNPNNTVSAAPVRPPAAGITNLIDSVRDQFTGGIGVIFNSRSDIHSGVPFIVAVACGSTADQAGLKGGDYITSIDGLSTTNMPLTNALALITGYSGGKIKLTIERGSNAPFECVVERVPWNELRLLKHQRVPIKLPRNPADIRTHVIQSGETIQRICSDFQTFYHEITNLNPGLDPVRLVVGREIKVYVDANQQQ